MATEPNNRSSKSSLTGARAAFFDCLEVGQLTTARGREDRILFHLDAHRNPVKTCQTFRIKRAALLALAEQEGERELAALVARS